ncbi:MAG: T9SS C-terminal target domain-containing protein [Calditrichaeota bacterium]|nr:MAG: T9SS C-terminal target domain-containing protein [Calditrichota bacterium]
MFQLSEAVSIEYSSFLGSNDIEEVFSIDVSDNNEIVLSGTASSSSFPTTSGSFDQSFNGGNIDVFVTKFDSIGSSLIFSTFIGGTNNDYGYSIAIEGNGNTIVSGFTSSIDFPIQLAIGYINSGAADAFITKINPNGSNLIISSYYGGVSIDQSICMKIDQLGNIILAGKTVSLDFPTLAGYDSTHNGNQDVFISKFDSFFQTLLHSTFIGGAGDDRVYDIALDSFENIYLTGPTDKGLNALTNTYPTINAFDSTYNGSWDVFVSKLNSSGSSLLYSTFLGGNTDDISRGIVVDEFGSAILTGMTRSLDFPLIGAIDTTLNNKYDAFVSKLVPSGNTLDFSTYLGGADDDYGLNINLQENGKGIIIGRTESTDFPAINAYNSNLNGDSDLFISQLDLIGDSLEFSTFLGGSDEESQMQIGKATIYKNESLYITANTGSFDFPTTNGVYNQTYSGNSDIVVFRFVTNYSPILINQIPDLTFVEDSGNNLVLADLDSNFFDPDSSNLTYTIYTSSNGIEPFLVSKSLYISTVPDSAGVFSVEVTAIDTANQSVTDTFLVTINPVNDTPNTFNLINPTNNDTLINLTDTIEFEWNSSYDVDNTNLVYDLKIFNSTYDTTISNIADTTLSLQNTFEELSDFHWFVEVSDGEFVVSSSDTFKFTNPMAVKLSNFENQIPDLFVLHQNYPNPFNPKTNIRFDLPENSQVKLKIYNLLGQEVRTLINEEMSAGFKSVIWNGKNNSGNFISSGIYVYQIITDKHIKSKKMLFLK